MTRQDLLIELERQMGPLDERVQRAVSIVLDWDRSAAEQPRKPLPSPSAWEWQGENPSFAEMARRSAQERGRILKELEQRNRLWLEHRLRELGARWMLVIDGEVVRHSPTLADYLTDEQLLELCRERGKLPLLFLPLRPIEERAAWHPTVYGSAVEYPLTAWTSIHAPSK
jgi:hypothetical protein